MENTIEQLKIEIVAETTNASSGIRKLTSSFRSLKKLFTDSAPFKEVYNFLSDISKIDFSNLKELQTLADAFRAFTSKRVMKTVAQTSEITTNIEPQTPYEILTGNLSTDINLPDFTPLVQQMEKANIFSREMIDNVKEGIYPHEAIVQSLTQSVGDYSEIIQRAKELRNIADNMPKVKNVFGEDMYSKQATQFVNMAVSIEQAIGEVERLKQELAGISEQIEIDIRTGKVDNAVQGVRQLSSTLAGLQSANASVRQLANSMNKLGAATNDTNKKTNKWVATFLRIAMYRAVRAMIQKITQGIKDAFAQIAQVDSKFNATMSSITSSFRYLSDSFSSMLVPVLEALEPILVSLIDLFSDLFTEIAKIFSYLAGNTVFTKATKDVTDYANAVKGANNLMGFDELNTLDTGTSAESRFTQEDIQLGEDLTAILDDVKSVLFEIGGIIREIIDISKDFTMDVLPSLVKLIGGIISGLKGGILDAVKSLVESLGVITDNVTNMFTTIITALSPLIISILKGIGEIVGSVIVPLVETISTIISGVFEILSPIFEALSNIITPVIKIIANLLGAIFSVISRIIKAVLGQLKKPLEAVVKIIASILNVLSPFFELISGVFSFVFDVISKIFDAISENMPLVKMLEFFSEAIGTAVSVIADFISGIAGLIGNVFKIVRDFFTGDFDALKEDLAHFFDPIGDAIENIKKGFKNLWDWICKNIIEPIAKFFVETIPGFFIGVWNGFVSVFSSAGVWIFNNIIRPVGNFFVGMLNGIATGLEACVNFIIDAINGFTQGLSNVWTWAGIPAIPIIGHVQWGRIPEIQALATGGFPEDGLFFANHGELVGKFANGKTAVANNEQITQGIYNAVLEALTDGGFGQTNPRISVFLDSKEIAKEIKIDDYEDGIYEGGVLNGAY